MNQELVKIAIGKRLVFLTGNVWKDQPLIHIRHYYLPVDDEGDEIEDANPLPSKRGVALTVKEFQEMLTYAGDVIDAVEAGSGGRQKKSPKKSKPGKKASSSSSAVASSKSRPDKRGAGDSLTKQGKTTKKPKPSTSVAVSSSDDSE